MQNIDNSPGSDVVFQCLLPGDDATLLEAARQDPLGFVEGLPERVILDEVQRAPELLLAIKAVVDRDRQPGSGSGYGLLMRFVVVYDVSDRPIVLALRLWSHP